MTPCPEQRGELIPSLIYSLSVMKLLSSSCCSSNDKYNLNQEPKCAMQLNLLSRIRIINLFYLPVCLSERRTENSNCTRQIRRSKDSGNANQRNMQHSRPAKTAVHQAKSSTIASSSIVQAGTGYNAEWQLRCPALNSSPFQKEHQHQKIGHASRCSGKKLELQLKQ